MQITCRVCHKPTVFDASNPFRPFCSERCQMIDLGLWAQESYTVAGESIDIDVNKKSTSDLEKEKSEDSEE